MKKFKAKLVEYQEIQHLRDLWSKGMGGREQIFIPLGAAIVSFFLTFSLKFYLESPKIGIYFLLIGWGLFSLVMVYWRYLSHHVDQQIVGMYPRMLELEKDLEMETQASYYFRNLNQESKNYLARELGNVTSTEVNNWDYCTFKNYIRNQNLNKKPHDYLLSVWDKFKNHSVTSRGHAYGNILIASIIGIWLVIDGVVIWHAIDEGLILKTGYIYKTYIVLVIIAVFSLYQFYVRIVK